MRIYPLALAGLLIGGVAQARVPAQWTEKSTEIWLANDGLKCYPYRESNGKFGLAAIKNDVISIGVVTASSNTVRPLGTLNGAGRKRTADQTDLRDCMIFRQQMLK